MNESQGENSGEPKVDRLKPGFAVLTAFDWTFLVGLILLSGLPVAGSFYQPMAIFADASPLAFAVACASLLVTAIARASRAARYSAATATALLASNLAPETAALVSQRIDHAGSDKLLKVLSANVWSENPVHQPFLDFVASEDPDIIVAVEAYKFWKPVLDNMAPKYRIVAGCLEPHLCDVVILSKLQGRQVAPLLSSRVVAQIDLPQRLGGGDFEVMGLHLSRPPLWAGDRPDLTAAAEAAAMLGPRVIVAGDFNSTSWSAPLRKFDALSDLTRHTRWLMSWPTPQKGIGGKRLRSPLPLAPIDHVYSGRGWRLAEISRGPDIGSDHYPVVATFALTSP